MGTCRRRCCGHRIFERRPWRTALPAILGSGRAGDCRGCYIHRLLLRAGSSCLYEAENACTGLQRPARVPEPCRTDARRWVGRKRVAAIDARDARIASERQRGRQRLNNPSKCKPLTGPGTVAGLFRLPAVAFSGEAASRDESASKQPGSRGSDLIGTETVRGFMRR